MGSYWVFCGHIVQSRFNHLSYGGVEWGKIENYGYKSVRKEYRGEGRENLSREYTELKKKLIQIPLLQISLFLVQIFTKIGTDFIIFGTDFFKIWYRFHYFWYRVF